MCVCVCVYVYVYVRCVLEMRVLVGDSIQAPITRSDLNLIPFSLSPPPQITHAWQPGCLAANL
mgnify:CR=1 FL=1